MASQNLESKHAGGRPSKLTPELIEKAGTYLDSCYTRPITTDRGALSYSEVNLPTIVGLALYLKIDKDTVYTWCKVGEEIDEENAPLRKRFSDIVKEVTEEQEKWLINYTAGGLYQPKLSSMLLSKHGYVEKTETDITSGGDKIQSTAVLPEVIAEADRILKERKLNQKHE